MFRDITQNDLETIRTWRNDPRVRKTMFTDHEISAQEHLAWWQRLRDDNSRKSLIFVMNQHDAGIVNFFAIEPQEKSCHWGFYLAADINDPALMLSVWQALEQEAIDYAFKQLQCEQLICETFKFNQPVLEMHRRFGFVETGREVRLKNGNEEEVIITALTNKDLKNSQASDENNNRFTRFKSHCLILSSTNTDFITAAINQYSQNYSAEISWSKVPYGQHQIEVSKQDSPVLTNSYDFVLYIERVEDFLPLGAVLDSQFLEKLESRWTDYLSWIRQCRQKINGYFLIANPVSVSDWHSGLNEANEDRQKIINTLQKMNRQLRALSHSLADTYILDLQGVMTTVGRHNAHPEKYWYLARAPFSSSFNQKLSEQIMAMMLALKGFGARVIVLDLDNTLWKGIIGDDGLNGIVVDGDYPGNVYQAIQKLFKVFKSKGYLLAICSKNNELTALEVFEKHPGMQLKQKDFSTWQINWQDKSTNLVAIAEKLGLSLASFCLIDDNPLERAEIKKRLPEVFVPDLPEEISEWPEFIKQLPELSFLEVNDEDKQRNQQYQIRHQLQNITLTEESRAEFLNSLGIKIALEHYCGTNQQRILQLIQKTNQFNATTRRYTQIDLEGLLAQGDCFAIRIKDNLGTNEIAGVLIVLYEHQVARIDNFILSCRVLGRELEIAVLHWLVNFLCEKKMKTLIGELIPTDRNEPVQALYKRSGFEQMDQQHYKFELAEKSIEKPVWITIE
jgi:UDP-4-amino-4,6-dideoxy-N-acetyl-beta-L-altrosamine N-acetyltransferase